MTYILEEHHRQIAAGIAEIRNQCRLSAPDTAALGAARLRLSQASSARSRYVRETLIPELRKQANQSLLAELDTMQRFLTAKRLISSEHITTWSNKKITADWSGYREAARRIWAMMEEQMHYETNIVRNL